MRVPRLDVGAIFARVASFSARRATLVLAVAGLLSLAGLGLALMLDPGRTGSAAGDGGGSSASATKELRGRFGGDPIVVLVRGRLTGMLLTEDVARMLSLEGCISGNAPRGAEPAAPVCSRFARDRPVQVVYGPGTFINEAANQVLDRINFDRAREAAEADRAAREARRVARRRGLSAAQQEQFAQEARRIVTARYAQRALELAVRFGLSSVPALNNPEFVLQLVFEPSLGAEFPKPRFAYLFPHSDAAVIQARLRPGLGAEERAAAVDMVREAVGAKPFDLKFGTYVVSGSPVVAEGVADGLSDAAPALVAAVLLLVALALVLAFRRRPVLLPLALGAGATAITLGGVSLAGGSFSPGVAGALPVLCALGAAWALRLHHVLDDEPRMRAAGPAVALAALASALAFAALLLSPVSLTRSFGAIVALGLVVSFALALTAGAAFLARRERMARRLAPVTRRLTPDPRRFRPAARRARLPRRIRAPRRLATAARSVAGSMSATPALLARAWSAARRTARERPGRVLRIALLLAVGGWFAGSQIDVTADQERLLPADSVEARDLASIERETGTPGDVNLIVRSSRLLDPAVVQWMSSYQRRVLRQNGFREGRPCREADLCPALSLTNLFGAGRQSARQIREAVDAMPRYFSQNVITPDRRTANIAFRMGAMAPEERRAVIERLREELNPPAGVDADLAGPVVAAADGEGDITRSMWLVSLAALLLVTALLALAARSLQAALTVALPLGLAVGWAFLIVYLLPIDVDFLTAAMGAIVVAVCAGPAVLAARRYGHESADLEGTLVAFGAVVVAGFLALTVSDIPALRDLGAAGAVVLPACGLGLALTLPATAVWVERRGGLRVPRTRSELAAAGRALGGAMRAAVRSTAAGARRVGGAVRRGFAAAGRAVPRPGRNSP
jgi:predicted RND superfamily exporter protein